MKIDEVFSLWDKDSTVDRSDLAVESLTIPVLHNKYYKILIQERLRLKKMKADFAEIQKIYQEYYLGQLSEDELKEHQLKPYPLRILKQDLDTYLNSDKTIIEWTLKIFQQGEKVELLESIIKTVAARTFHIKNAIDFIKFQNGT